MGSGAELETPTGIPAGSASFSFVHEGSLAEFATLNPPLSNDMTGWVTTAHPRHHVGKITTSWHKLLLIPRRVRKTVTVAFSEMPEYWKKQKINLHVYRDCSGMWMIYFWKRGLLAKHYVIMFVSSVGHPEGASWVPYKEQKEMLGKNWSFTGAWLLQTLWGLCTTLELGRSAT